MLEIIGLDENNNKVKIPLTSGAGSGNPLGTIIAVYSNHVPDGYLPCNGTTFDQTQYPALYTLLGTNVLPDYRECALVGAGYNATNVFDSTETDPNTGLAGTQDHDEFTIGEFKDDQFQGHGHDVPYNYGTSGSFGGVIGGSIHEACATTPMTLSGYSKVRFGTVTRGKRKGVNFCIKATAGITENQADYVGDIIKDYVNQRMVPDYARGSLYTTASTSYTCTEDCYVVYTGIIVTSNPNAMPQLQIDGQIVSVYDYTGTPMASVSFTGFVKKGSVISKANGNSISVASLKVFGLTV